MYIKILEIISKFKNRNKKGKNIELFYYGGIQSGSDHYEMAGIYIIEQANNISHIHQLVSEFMLESFVSKFGGDKNNLIPIIKNIIFYKG